MASTARAARNLSLSLALGLLAACSGSSGSGGSSAVTLAVTDAASDEIVSFVVRLASVRLESASGDMVDVLPDDMGVDFAELTDLSRVLNIQRVSPGQYVGAEVTLDFSEATAVLSGNTTPAAIVDSDGNVLTGIGAPGIVLPVTMAAPLEVVAGRNHVLELDFDLDQSVTVDTGGNEVVVEPNLVVRFDPTLQKELAIGGRLRSVQEMDGTFRLGLDAAPAAPIPIVTIAIDDASVFQIDGVATEGDAGLAQLAGLSVGSWVQAFGSVDADAALFRAVTVEAGRGSYNGGSAIVEGHIVERVGGVGSDAVFTVLGHSNNENHTTFAYNLLFTVNTSFANTKIVRRGSSEPFDLDDLNVGQHVRMFGTLGGGNTLDATGAADVIRMQPTTVLGFSNAAPAGGQLEIELARVDLRAEDAFTWTDSGATPPDPLHFVMEIGNLASQPEGLGIHAGNLVTPVSVVGYFAPIDDTGADFVASRLVNRRLANSLLVVHDREGGLTVTPTVTPTEIVLDLSGTAVAGEIAIVDQGFAGSTAMASPSAPSIIPRNQPDAGYYAIRDRTMNNAVTIYFSFADFSAGLDEMLMAGAVIYDFSVVGHYAAVSDQISTALVGVVVD